MPLASGRDQHAMNRIGLIVGQRLALERGQHAAGFVHQKISSRKVPIVAVAAGDGRIQFALRHARQAQCKRMDARHRHDPGCCVAIWSNTRRGPAIRAP